MAEHRSSRTSDDTFYYTVELANIIESTADGGVEQVECKSGVAAELVMALFTSLWN